MITINYIVTIVLRYYMTNNFDGKQLV